MKRPEKGKLKSALLVSLLVLGLPLLAWAQGATIVGTVTDPSGSIIPGVTITLTNTQTGIVTRAITNDAGQYVVSNLRVGKYDLPASVVITTASQAGLNVRSLNLSKHRLAK